MARKDTGQRKEFLRPVPADRVAMDEAEAGVHPRQQVMTNVRTNRVGLDGISVIEVGIEGVAPVASILNALQVRRRLREKQQITVKQRHAVRLQEGDEVKDLRGEQVGIAKMEAAREFAQHLGQLCIGLRAPDDARGGKVVPQSCDRGIIERAVLVDAQREAPAARHIERFERPNRD